MTIVGGSYDEKGTCVIWCHSRRTQMRLDSTMMTEQHIMSNRSKFTDAMAKKYLLWLYSNDIRLRKCKENCISLKGEQKA